MRFSLGSFLLVACCAAFLASLPSLCAGQNRNLFDRIDWKQVPADQRWRQVPWVGLKQIPAPLPAKRQQSDTIVEEPLVQEKLDKEPQLLLIQEASEADIVNEDAGQKIICVGDHCGLWPTEWAVVSDDEVQLAEGTSGVDGGDNEEALNVVPKVNDQVSNMVVGEVPSEVNAAGDVKVGGSGQRRQRYRANRLRNWRTFRLNKKPSQENIKSQQIVAQQMPA